jgi:amino acid permease
MFLQTPENDMLLTIGIRPGVWYGTGYALNNSGPVGALLCFIIIGVDVYFVMQSLGEMSTLFPTPGAFVEVCQFVAIKYTSNSDM